MPNLDYTKESNIELTEELKQAIHAILTHCEKEDEFARQIQLREAKQLDHFWHGLQHIFWDKENNDWRIPTHEQIASIVGDNDFAYDTVVNIFKAHGESIIAALASDLPTVNFAPENAEIASDIRCAQAATTCSKKIQEYNNAKTLFIQALFTLFNNHYLACYNYYERDSKYGITKIDNYEKKDVKTTPDTSMCESCGAKFDEVVTTCPHCFSDEITTIPGITEKLPVLNGQKEVNRGMERLGIFSVLDVKISTHAKDQESCGYLIKYAELPYPYVSDIYDVDVESNDSSDDSYGRAMRSPAITQGYNVNEDSNLVTVKQIWIRPWMYRLSKEFREMLHQHFPKGIKYTCVGTKFLDAVDEGLDDHWTITKSGPSRNVSSVPLGSPIVPIQETRNTVRNISIETLERGIPFTFADPQTLDFDKFEQTEVAIGQYFPAKRKTNSAMGDSFFESRAATLSKEVPELEDRLDEDAQFTTGDVPSIHGAAAQGGSKTLGEYVNSRNYALQRLSIPWQYISIWWGEVMYKSVNSYFNHMIDDEYHVEKQGRVYRNIWIKKATTEGKFKLLVPEVGTEFPVSFAQKSNIIMKLVELNNPLINEWLYSPENAQIVTRFGGLQDLVIPGEDQAMKQLREIEKLTQEIPLEEPIQDQITGEPIPKQKSSVPVDPEIDDHEIHMRVIKTFLVSDAGQDLKMANPEFYENCILHYAEHKQLEQVQQLEEMMNQQKEQLPENQNA